MISAEIIREQRDAVRMKSRKPKKNYNYRPQMCIKRYLVNGTITVWRSPDALYIYIYIYVYRLETILLIVTSGSRLR